MTTKFCVVGTPIEHSLSPILHLAAYKHLDLDFEYDKQEVFADGLGQFLDSSSFSGVSVTMPLKYEAFAIASTHDTDAALTGVVNTLMSSSGEWDGYNTDVYGIRQALSGISKPDRTIVIGSGATARSGLLAVASLFPQTHVSVVSRNAQAGDELVSFATSLGLDASVAPASSKTLLSGELVMSLVPAGSFEQLWGDLRNSNQSNRGVLFDVAYNPWPSSASLAWGQAKVVSGIEMLIWQAIEQVNIFSSTSGPVLNIDRFALYEVMKAAVSAK